MKANLPTNYLLRCWKNYITLLLATCFAHQLFAKVPSQSTPIEDETTLLLSRLNLDTPGLEKVRAAANEPTNAAAELLAYYRNRTHVKHLVERKTTSGTSDQIATKKDIQVANDALKHIFVGQPAYPSHFCGEDIDWSTNPYPDKEWVWQLNRMSFWEAMAQAYRQTGDEKYAKEWGKQLVDWTRKNPRDADHAYAWRSIEAGIRGYRWTKLFQYFVDSPGFTPEVLVAYLNSCYEHANYLMTKYSKGSNWALMEAEGMAFIAMTFPEFRQANAWNEEAVSRLNREITNQVYTDG
ncbi:heparinase II/III family protein, partial [Persicitalea sp.]|uniref:heparinase II/III family protein n=1 Tax=Persicitalea sp. TaxID=3100273 RepID=UPI0035948581